MPMSSLTAIATDSPEEGLDLAASLLSHGIQAQVQAEPNAGAGLAASLAQFISFRYASEFGLAWEELISLGDACKSGGFSRDQFWLQMHWTGRQIGLPEIDFVSRTLD